MANKDTAKLWFQTNDFPTESQFAQVFDWQRWKDEKIAFADLTPELQALIASVNNTLEFDGTVHQWNFPAHTLIERVFVLDTMDINFSMGTTLGGKQIFEDVLIEIADVQTGVLTKPYYCLNETTIYWSGNNLNSKVKIYKN